MAKDAATVIVLRASQGGFEVLLARRHHKSAFMADAYVFPGGKLDPADTHAALAAHLPPNALTHAAERMDATPGCHFDASTALGLHVAALRELYEEVGVLLALDRAGSPVALADPAVVARFAEHRSGLHAGRHSFAELLACEGLVLAIDKLVYWAHWITPSMEPRRYDTRFFITVLPPGQVASSDQRETTDMVWLSPEDALSAYRARKILLGPPTLRNLEDLAGLASIEAVMEAAHSRRIAAVLPKVASISGRVAILLPWDPLYAKTDGDGFYDPDNYPHPMAAGPSRLVLEGEHWVSQVG